MRSDESGADLLSIPLDKDLMCFSLKEPNSSLELLVPRKVADDINSNLLKSEQCTTQLTKRGFRCKNKTCHSSNICHVHRKG